MLVSTPQQLLNKLNQQIEDIRITDLVTVKNLYKIINRDQDVRFLDAIDKMIAEIKKS